MSVIAEQVALKMDVRRPVRIIKAADRTKSPEDYKREHEIALLRLIGPEHPEVLRELAEVVVK